MDIKSQIRDLADRYAQELKKRLNERVSEMDADDTSHFLIYRVLGITDEEGRLIDVYQNKGRLLYRYAGTFLEKAALCCLEYKYPDGGPVRIPNTLGRRPKTFQIDFLIENQAFEIKWRDATTDGDHVTKEHTRVLAVADAGYSPIRVMFYYPNRDQAIKIQRAIAALYRESGGAYYSEDEAWDFIKERTGIDLKCILEEIAKERGVKSGSHS